MILTDNNYSISSIKKSLKRIFSTKSGLSSFDIQQETNLILENVLGLSYEHIVSRDIILLPEHIEQINSIIEARLKGRALAYILGEHYFYGYKFKVNENVLIPRPETELLVETGLMLLDSCTSNNYQIGDISIIDLCTGSGCISIAIAKELVKRNINNFRITAIDICPEALLLASENAKSLNVSEYIDFIEADLLSFRTLPLDNSLCCDLLVSNPPYITPKEYNTLDTDVRGEPYLALVGDSQNTDGLLYYRQIAELLKVHTKAKHISLEIDPSRASSIKELFDTNYETQLLKDYNKLDRIIMGELH